MKKIMLILSMSMFISLVSYAQEHTPRVNARQDAQQSRIQHGKNGGELTHKETALLKGEQKKIRRTERRAKADGNITMKERRLIDRKQDRANRHIRKAKNNDVKPV
jgi:hypothetical protein